MSERAAYQDLEQRASSFTRRIHFRTGRRVSLSPGHILGTETRQICIRTETYKGLSLLQCHMSDTEDTAGP